MSKKSMIDPEDLAFEGLLKGIRTNCVSQRTTSRKDIQRIVDYYKPRYPKLTVELIVKGVQSAKRKQIGRKSSLIIN